ncbi:Na+_driven multidrug efflux pump [Hexamita inflata]|uniref:Na+ driven multidrug efflux pump n=1 Tax=Hexamita inflata TaxID=28002 RepID=A0AA86R6Z8_9EUKA|nr:Na+ driven multidrug efflux pump [Hexamita inflata]
MTQTEQINKPQDITAAVDNNSETVNAAKLESDTLKQDKIINRLRDFNVDTLIWYFALPAIVANVVSAVTNIAQQNLMKKFIGDVGVAAQGVVQPLELILTMYISVGLSGGLVSFVSPALGKGDYYTVQKYFMHYMIYLFLIMIIVPVFTLPFMGKIVISLGAEEGTDMFKYAKQYGYVIFSIGTLVYSINYGFGNILRATSRSLFNAIKQIFTACIEFLMVYIFYTFVVQKGHVQTYTNAAAPVIANFITGCAVISLFIPFKRLNRTYKLKFAHKGWKPFDFLAMVEMLIIAIPDLLTQFQGPVVKIVGNKIIAKITKSYAQKKYQVAVLQMVANLSALVNTSNQSFGFAFGPSFGYALGMKNWNRVREIMRKTFYYQTGLNLILWIIMNGTVYYYSNALIHGYWPMVDDCTFGFRCFNAVMPLLTCFLCVNDINQMEQKPIKATLIQFSRMVLVIVMQPIISYSINNVKGIYYGVLVGDLAACIIGMINFVERYMIYGKLERGEITTQQARIAEVTGDMKRWWRKSRKEQEKSNVQTRDMAVAEEPVPADIV